MGLHIRPRGRIYSFDDFRADGMAKPTLLIGADPECDIWFDDPTVSGRHCEIERRAGGGVLIRDCESTNKTWLNGRAVTMSELLPGHVLRVGCTVMQVFGAINPQEPIPIVATTMRTFLHGAVQVHGTVRDAARAIGVSRSTLSDWLNKKFSLSDTDR